MDDKKLAEYNEISKYELRNMKRVLPFIEKDKRFGYHSEAHGYMFDAESITKKIASLDRQL